MSHLCDCRTSEDEVPCVTCQWLEQGRLTKLIEDLPKFTYHGVAIGGIDGSRKILDQPSPLMLERDAVLAILRGEQK
jgi:hypothetical protein